MLWSYGYGKPKDTLDLNVAHMRKTLIIQTWHPDEKKTDEATAGDTLPAPTDSQSVEQQPQIEEPAQEQSPVQHHGDAHSPGMPFGATLTVGVPPPERSERRTYGPSVWPTGTGRRRRS